MYSILPSVSVMTIEAGLCSTARQRAQPVLRLQPRGDVVQGRQQQAAAGHLDFAGMSLQHAEPAVPRLPVEQRRHVPRRTQKIGNRRLAIARAQPQFIETQRNEQRARVAEEGAGLLAGVHDAAGVRVGQQVDEVVLVEQLAVAALALPQRQALRDFVRGVGGDAAITGEGAGGVEDRRAARARIADFAFRRQ